MINRRTIKYAQKLVWGVKLQKKTGKPKFSHFKIILFPARGIKSMIRKGLLTLFLHLLLESLKRTEIAESGLLD